MKILAIDTSSMMGSVALVEEDRVVAEELLNIEVTHSERLLSSISSILGTASLKPEEVDGLALAIGPGSFTGLRIGLGAVKGMAFALNKPVVGISTLKGVAFNVFGTDFPVASIMDARRGEYYIGIYKFTGNRAKIVLKDTVLPPEELLRRTALLKEKIFFVGDGVYSLHEKLKKKLKKNAVFGLPSQLHPRASNIAFLAMPKFKSGKTDDLGILVPNYIRKSDAEK